MAVFHETVGGDFEARINEFANHMKLGVACVGAQAMSEIVYQSAKVNVPVSGIPTHYFYGSAAKQAKPGEKKQYAYAYHSGDLQGAIYQVFSQDRSGDDRKEYHVGWNHQKVPYGFMVEFGTAKAAAHPFLYPAFNQNRNRLLPAACDAMRNELMAGVR